MSPHHEENPYMREVNTKSKWENFRLALYNPEEKTVLGRKGRMWGVLAIFYGIFYAVLAALFAICMIVMLKVLPEGRPMYSLSSSLIGENPGMGFRPQFVDEGSLIWYNVQNDTDIAKYVDQLDEWLEQYTNLSYPGASGRVPCDFELPPPLTQACIVNTSTFGPCVAGNLYGYKDKKPCIFIKINRIYGWEPDCYTTSTEEPTMPDDLKAYIDKKDPKEREQVWISCKGESPGDNEGLNYDLHLGSNISYYPSQGMPLYYYPYRNQFGYVNPIIAVQFTNLEPGRIINVRCRAWAKNIIYSKSLKVLSGSTHIEFMIDDQPLS